MISSTATDKALGDLHTTSFPGMLFDALKKSVDLQKEIVDNISFLSTHSDRLKYLSELEALAKMTLKRERAKVTGAISDYFTTDSFVNITGENDFDLYDEEHDEEELFLHELLSTAFMRIWENEAFSDRKKSKAASQTIFAVITRVQIDYYERLLTQIRSIKRLFLLLGSQSSEVSIGNETKEVPENNKEEGDAFLEPAKIMTSLNVPKLAYFFRVLLASGVIELDKGPKMARHQTDIQHIVSKTFATKSSNSPHLETDWKLSRVKPDVSKFWIKKFKELSHNSDLDTLKTIASD